MKRRHLLILPLAALSLLAACSPSGDKPGAPSGDSGSGGGKGRLFAASFMTMNNPFFVDLNEGLKKVVESKGDRLVTLDSQFNSLKQKNDLSDVLQQNPAAIFLNPVNWEGIRGSLIEAKRKGVPIIVVDTDVSDAELVLCQVISDNIGAGRLACEELAKVKPNAKVVILHLSTAKSCIDRVAGFKEVMAKHPGMTLLDTQEGKGSIEGGRPVMRDLLGRYPDLDAVFPINDPCALGAFSAIEAAGKTAQVTIVTVDGSREAAAAIKEGKIHSTSAQFPKEIGRVAAEKAYEHLAGNAIEKDIRIPVKSVTKENAGEFLK
ncbi:monosaccharide ABC transporter substrate-binding protein (CUT2 family) [Roseimicrobium gellanilyticum]|uniref:Monosaccharide ABC transporter substrate-binding protein (CUT2 family) n=1 Tax=Roseimicrobium gellanilyticum TaxID=748857 RepID=A0A366HS94_9BACT|nr:sugar ABC transporter substrate-binding protein [Roseimicrobium gellanilyticum]RBP45968.1 monosaccharide ABC transporter substrate-binding protein (CUT2 family) [Roseimicrobium gellanilyticum]